MAYYTESDFPTTNWNNLQGYTPSTLPTWAPRTDPLASLWDDDEEAEDSISNTVTDAAGNEWIMTPGGQWVPAGSDYAEALAAGTAAGPGMYDSSGAFVGAESQGERLNVRWGGGPFSVAEWGSSDLDPIDVQKAALAKWNEKNKYIDTEDEIFIDDAGNRFREVYDPRYGKKVRIGMGGRKPGLKVVTKFVDYMRNRKNLLNLFSTKPTAEQTTAVDKFDRDHRYDHMWRDGSSPTASNIALARRRRETTINQPYLDAYRAALTPIDYSKAVYRDDEDYDPEEIYSFEGRAPLPYIPSQYQQGLMYDDKEQLGYGLLSPYAITSNMLEYTGQQPTGFAETPTDYVQQRWANDPQQAAGWARKNAFDAVASDDPVANYMESSTPFNWAGSSPVVQENTGAIDDDEDDDAYAGMLEGD